MSKDIRWEGGELRGEALRWIARWLDITDEYLETYFARLRDEFDSQGNTEGVEGADKVLDLVRGKHVQEDLRRWAGELDAAHGVSKTQSEAENG